MDVQEHIAVLNTKVASLETEVAGLREDVKELLSIMNAAKGSWRTLVVVGAVATTLAAGLATVWGWVRP